MGAEFAPTLFFISNADWQYCSLGVFLSESKKEPESKHLRLIPVNFHISQLEAWFSTTLSLKLGN